MKRSSKQIVLAIMLISLSGLVFAAGDKESGKKISSQCAMCHGLNGKGMGNIPAITGLDEGTFLSHLSDFKTGKRKNSMMEGMAKKLSDKDAENLAAYYSSL